MNCPTSYVGLCKGPGSSIAGASPVAPLRQIFTWSSSISGSRSKEVKFSQDLEALVSEPPRSVIVDAFVKGAEEWDGKFREFIKSRTYDPALGGYPPASSLYAGTTRDNTLDTNTVFDNVKENPLTPDTFIDLHSSEELKGVTGALGGGGDFDGGNPMAPALGRVKKGGGGEASESMSAM
ncbi:hypothetical protein DFH08DRAFT_809926 [Mycena albidolilacea]|uniref:Uncharacterized protein n=1 Tax=Mycena albidolilacea TaxID=1033008 RepID=A0AAD6ZZV4_9AGAR|nr:hypothetical protein DFH08DRAFT_809926 [Mycena albidolilacea]